MSPTEVERTLRTFEVTYIAGDKTELVQAHSISQRGGSGFGFGMSEHETVSFYRHPEGTTLILRLADVRCIRLLDITSEATPHA